YEVIPVTSSFVISELLPYAYTRWENEGFFWEQRNSDTVYSRNLEFEAPEGMDKYTWVIGSEVLHDRVIVRKNFPPNEIIPITLIVERTPNRECFPNDDGIDTLVRNLFYEDDYYNSLFFGEYKGHFLRLPNDDFIIKFEGKPPFTIGDTSFTEYARFGNLFQACQEVVFMTGGLNANRFLLFETGNLTQGGGSCGSPMGKIKVTGTNDEKIRIEFRYINGDNYGPEVPAPNDLFIFEGIRQ
ncbi:MAG: hypothetical protein HC803_10675, partial [Saprospiraceae bacterium]|nr:hypothetical protein [Saprospiraceae bacterium]